MIGARHDASKRQERAPCTHSGHRRPTKLIAHVLLGGVKNALPSADPAQADKPPRYHAIDKLRATMILIVMFGHAMLPYLTVPRGFKDPQTHIGFDVAGVFLYSFAMQVFFLTAGFAAGLLYARRGGRGLAANRVRRILYPLLAAYLLIVPLTRAAYDFSRTTVATGSIDAGLEILLLGEWLRWGGAYHLWFLVSLLLFSALAVGLRHVLRRVIGDQTLLLSNAARKLFASRYGALMLTPLVAITTVPAWIFGAGEGTSPFMQVTMFGFFVLGWLLSRHHDLLPRLSQRPWHSIAIAIAVIPLAVWSSRLRLMAADEMDLGIGVVAGITNSLLAAYMSFGLLGLFQSRTGGESALGRYLSDASYWIFLIHFPIVIALGGALTVTPWPAGVKYLLTVGIAAPIVLLSYHFGVRLTPLNRVIGAGRTGRADGRD